MLKYEEDLDAKGTAIALLKACLVLLEKDCFQAGSILNDNGTV